MSGIGRWHPAKLVSTLMDLTGELCISKKIAFSVFVALIVVIAALSIAYNNAIRKARTAMRRLARQPQQQGAKDVVAATEVENEVTVSAEEKATAKQFGMLDGPYKMVLCVNMSLKMEKGKIAAQCGHATLACYRKSLKMCPDAVSWWERLGQAKIALKISDESEMEAIHAKAKALGLATYIVEDAGRTQIAAGSRTVLGIGPAPVKVIDSITSHLKLL